MPERGFILQPTYRILGGRPVVHLYGRLENGATFLVLDDRDTPYFYVLEEDAKLVAELGGRVAAEETGKPPRTTMDGHPVRRVDAGVPPDVPALRDRLRSGGVASFEADVRFAMRYLVDRGIRGMLEIEGPWHPGRGVDRVYRNPIVAPYHPEATAGNELAPRLSVLSLDIETDPRARRLLSIALYGRDHEGKILSEVLLFRPRGLVSEDQAPEDAVPPGAFGLASERDVLAMLCERVRALDPDIITGWNLIDFDLRVLDRLSERWRVPLALGRGPGTMRLRPSRAPWSAWDASVPGRLLIDGLHLMRSSFVRFERMSLDAVSREVLGEGKTSLSDGDPESGPEASGRSRNHAADILDAFRHDPALLVEYNLTDARLVLEILEELRLLPLAMERSRLTGLPLDRVGGSIAAFDFLYLMELGKRGVVAPSVEWGSEGGDANLGGWVLEPEPGLWENVLVFDFKSLYPSLIRTFQIDPLGYLPASMPRGNAIVAPNGAAFRRQPGILPGLLDELMPRREEAKHRGDDIASHAIKILMNSFYGVLGSTACRFARPALAGAITAFGREILRWTKARCEEIGYRVLYGDTDSIFVLSGVALPAEARALANDLAGHLNRDIADHLRAEWDVESRLELEFERLYRRLFLLSARHGGGARKRYVGLVEEEGGEEEESGAPGDVIGSKDGSDTDRVIFTGMEVVRRDWTELAKTIQRELYERLFRDRDVTEYLRREVEALRAGERDALLVYRKGLRKKLEEYTATTPPHVAAARKMTGKVGRVIDYVMTVNGPEPAGERRSAIDHEHYVQKQVRPVAEPVLEELGLALDKVVGDDAQMELFE